MNRPPRFDVGKQHRPILAATQVRYMYRNVQNFRNLTPLRFIAASLVVIFHVEETRKMFDMPNLTRYSIFSQGSLAVTFFFVLSGFLITYLLLREHAQRCSIDVPRFYIRRVLRIWPLYFLMVFIGLVLIPAGIKLGRVRYEAPFHSLEVAPYFLLFVSFVVNLTYGNHFLTPLWSVGVEEMYYLIWAPIVKWFRKRLMFILAGTMIIKVALAIWVHYVSHHALLAEALRMLQFEAMAIGGFAAYFLFHRTRPLSRHWLFFRPTQGVLVSLLMIRLFFHGTATKSMPLYATMFDHAVYAPLLFMVVFAWFILNVAVNERSIVRFDWRPLNYLGDISYGIYMYHGLAISLLFVPLREEYQAVTFIPATLLLHALVAAFTLLFAATSKAFFEDRFLRYKRQFQARTDRAEFVDGGKRPTTTATRELAA